MRRLLILLILAVPSLAQEVFVHPIPIGCTSVTVPATPTVAGSVTISCPALKITTPIVLPKATQNSPYSANLAALAKPTGGVPPYAYTLDATNPVPPSWLKLSLGGIITGTPTATGNVNFSFTVSDSSTTLTQSGQGSLTVKHGPVHAVVNFRADDFVCWGVFVHGFCLASDDCSGAECGVLRYNPPKAFEFAKNEPNPWWFLSLRGSGLRTMRSSNAR